MTSIVPELETARLSLRGWRRSDWPVYRDSLSDLEANRFTGGVQDARTAWRMFCAATGMWVLDGAGWWAVCERATGNVVGTVGAFYREHAPNELEVGWSIFRPYWRRGFATEAVRAVLAHVQPKIDHAIAYVDAANVASRAVAERVGFVHVGASELFGAPCERYECVLSSRSTS